MLLLLDKVLAPLRLNGAARMVAATVLVVAATAGSLAADRFYVLTHCPVVANTARLDHTSLVYCGCCSL